MSLRLLHLRGRAGSKLQFVIQSLHRQDRLNMLEESWEKLLDQTCVI